MKKEIIHSIKEKELQLKKLKSHINKSSVCADLYNKIIIEKAILKKELDDCNKFDIAKVFKSILPNKKTLICDYFKE